MKHKVLSLLAGTALISGLGAVMSEPSQAAPNVEFYCNPTTLTTEARSLSNPSIPPQTIARWRTMEFAASGYTPQVRCQMVSSRFQQRIENGTMGFITAGMVKGLPVVCSVNQMGEGCHDDNVLITLNSANRLRAAEVLETIFQLRRGTRVNPILESGGRTYISVEELLAPLASAEGSSEVQEPMATPTTPTPTDSEPSSGGFSF